MLRSQGLSVSRIYTAGKVRPVILAASLGITEVRMPGAIYDNDDPSIAARRTSVRQATFPCLQGSGKQ